MKKFLFLSCALFVTLSSTAQQRFTQSGETVKDNWTGLIWQGNDDGKQRNYKSAVAYCDKLSWGGYSDWRLPTVKELSGLVDIKKYNPAAEPILKLRTDDWYWSGSVHVSESDKTWGVAFDDGLVGWDIQTLEGYVRCVRSGK